MIDKVLTQNKQSWDTMADKWFGTTALPVKFGFINFNIINMLNAAKSPIFHKEKSKIL